MTDPEKKNSKNYIEILGTGAVILGLVFVGFELRQNTAAIQAETMQGLSDASQEYLLLIGADANLTEIVRKGNRSPDQLSETEALQFFYLKRTQWIRYQNAFFQYQRGTMGDEDWSFYDSLICGSPGTNWESHRNALARRFSEYVEACKSN
jgi:hypothetical protein